MDDDRLNWRPTEQLIIDYLLAIGVSILAAVLLKAADHFNSDFWTFVIVGMVVSTILIGLASYLTGIHAREDAQRRSFAPIEQLLDQVWAQRQLREMLKQAKKRKQTTGTQKRQ